MDVQILLVIVLFCAALFYVGKTILKTFSSKKSCGSNCKCGVDFSNIPTPPEKQSS